MNDVDSIIKEIHTDICQSIGVPAEALFGIENGYLMSDIEVESLNRKINQIKRYLSVSGECIYWKALALSTFGKKFYKAKKRKRIVSKWANRLKKQRLKKLKIVNQILTL
jgi:hypothetical protein